MTTPVEGDPTHVICGVCSMVFPAEGQPLPGSSLASTGICCEGG